jgi:hypothetical protein
MYYYKIFNVVYEKTTYKDTFFVNEPYKLTLKFIYLHKLFL